MDEVHGHVVNDKRFTKSMFDSHKKTTQTDSDIPSRQEAVLYLTESDLPNRQWCWYSIYKLYKTKLNYNMKYTIGIII